MINKSNAGQVDMFAALLNTSTAQILQNKVETKVEINPVDTVVKSKEMIKDKRELITLSQRNAIEKIKKEYTIRKIIKSLGGNAQGIEVEVEKDNAISTFYVSPSADHVFSMNRQAVILPNQVIILSIIEQEPNTEVQEKMLKKVQEYLGDSIKSINKRPGDYNILITTDKEIMSINQNGLILEWNTNICDSIKKYDDILISM